MDDFVETFFADIVGCSIIKNNYTLDESNISWFESRED